MTAGTGKTVKGLRKKEGEVVKKHFSGRYPLSHCHTVAQNIHYYQVGRTARSLVQKWTHLIYDYCRDEGIPGAEEERAVDEDLLEEPVDEEPVDEEQQEREKKHCWEIIRGFTLDTRPDLPEGPKQYQHFFLSELLDWVAEWCAQRGWEKERVCQNVKQWIYDFDMFSIEGDENCWIETCLQDD